MEVNKKSCSVSDDVIERLFLREIELDPIDSPERRRELDDAISQFESAIKEKCFQRYFRLGYEHCLEVHGLSEE